MGWDVLGHILGIKRQHPNLAPLGAEEIDNPEPSAFASPRDSPSQLADAARAGNYRSNFWVRCQRLLKLHVFTIGQILLDEACEQLGFDEAESFTHYTSMT